MTRRAEPSRDPITVRLMAAAREEADRARHGYVGCEHLLLALLTDKDPTARDILADHGIRLPAARAAVAGVISSGSGDGPRWNAADLLATLGVDLPAIQRQMRRKHCSEARAAPASRPAATRSCRSSTPAAPGWPQSWQP